MVIFHAIFFMTAEKEIENLWQAEFKKTAFKYHTIAVAVAIILNPIWIISDFYTIPNYFWEFLIFRLVVTTTCFFVFIFRKKLINLPEIIVFIPFFAISIQNAFMYSVMDIEQLQKHTFAYIALFIGASMLVLWKNIYSVFNIVLSFIANFIFFKINSNLTLEQILINGALLSTTVAVFSFFLINTRVSLNKKEIIARIKLSETNKLIEEQNRDITDSINYAKTIQYSIIPSEEVVQTFLKDSFVFYKPKDIVSGDFPFVFSKNNCIYLAVVDCTGHGVPGALMSVVGHFSLTQLLSNSENESPSEILDKLHASITKSLGQESELSTTNVGMDIAICKICTNSKTVEFSGANRPLYFMKDGVLEEIKSDRNSIGGSEIRGRKPYSNFKINLRANDSIFFFTDGLQDQFGGPDGNKKFMSKNIKRIVTENFKKPMAEIKSLISENFESWKGNNQQTDDILMIGYRF
jgi:phosphoserine phosphatase RsbU/P